VKGGANLDLLPANIHPRVREVMNRCLQKDLKRRYSSIAEARYEIEQVLGDPGGLLVPAIAGVESGAGLRKTLPWIAAAIVLGAILAGVAAWKLKPVPPSEPRRVIRFDHHLPDDQQFNLGTALGHTLAVSPDGSQFVYSTSKGLFLRSVDELEAKLVTGTESDPQSPFFSPDGKWIGYWSQADGKLKKIAMDDSMPVTLCDVTWLIGAIWHTDNTIVYSDVIKGILRVSANGGTPKLLVKGNLFVKQLLPDGKSLIFNEGSPTGEYRAVALQLESGVRKELFAGYFFRYLPTGHLVYELENNLYVVPFDLDKLEARGGAVPVVEKADFTAISDSGTLVYIPGTASDYGAARPLVWVDRTGKEEPLTAPLNSYSSLRISPDGTKVALSVGSTENTGIWIWDLVRKLLMRVTPDGKWQFSPLWTRDGKRIVYSSNRKDETAGIYQKAADGTGEPEKIGSAPDRHLLPHSFSRDGKALLLENGSKDRLQWNIAVLSLEGDHAVKPLMQEANVEILPQISPDGRWMAYTTAGEANQGAVYVRPFPDVNKGRWQISSGNGTNPLWSPDGRELFYQSGDAVMAVSVTTQPSFNIVGTPRVLFHGTYLKAMPGFGTSWDISPDGKRFLMIKPAESAAGASASKAPRKINVVLNWTDELKQRVPVK
ncbi:MAG: serine/threonine protein kinase, partial [Acidobacteria bacterium]|nr:serine/threonine protein kinase [Acidobacteriota bacterium]